VVCIKCKILVHAKQSRFSLKAASSTTEGLVQHQALPKVGLKNKE